MFLTHLGKGAVAVAVLGPAAVACSSDGGSSPTTATESTAANPVATTASPTLTPSTTLAPQGTSSAAPASRWERVILGNVSAYVLALGDRAAVVDTGRTGDESHIEAALLTLGLGWDSVDHVILTHLHSDHIGGLGPVMAAASRASAWAGESDISAMGASPRPVGAVGDGSSVFGLAIIETPGHTAGHISVHDPERGVLVAGDALNGSGGGVTGANPSFTPNMDLANASVKKLAGLEFETAYFGHGEPVISGADVLVAGLAADL